MLNIENLAKVFNIHILNDKVIEGFRGVTFSVREGTSVGISGPSGTGKSSILKCIYRTYLASEGKVWYESSQFGKVDLAHALEHVLIRIRAHEVGYTTQFLKVIPRIPALDVVAEPLVNDGLPAEQARRQAAEMLTRLQIPDRLFEAYPATFSGGEQQRVNIARAVIRRPRLLLLDEPTASLDRKTTGIVLDILKELRSLGTTMVGIFHDPRTLAAFADHIYEMPVMSK